MIRPGEVDFADVDQAFPHPVVVVSREELNRGDYILAAVITSARYSVRSRLPNCVAITAGQFGLAKDCVIQAETVTPIPKDQLDLDMGPVGILDEATLRDLIRAIGHVLDADCEPT